MNLNDISPSFLNFSTSNLDFIAEITDTSILNNYDGLLVHVNSFGIDSLGNVYIPQMNSTINVYNNKGGYKYSIGRGGRGPGEFLRLFSFDFSDDYKKLYVLDALEVEVFQLINGNYVYERSHIHNLLNVKSICSMGNSIFISGFSFTDPGFKNLSNMDRIASLPIQHFSIEPFELIKSFGYEYRSHIDMPQFNRFMSGTELACNSSTNTILGQLVSFPYMFGYSIEGDVKWISKFSNFLSTNFIEDSRPSVIPANEDVYHRIYPFREMHNSKYEMIQIGYHMPYWYNYAKSQGENPKKPTFEGSTYKTILIDSETGILKSIESDYMIGAINNDKALLIEITDSSYYKNKIEIYKFKQ